MATWLAGVAILIGGTFLPWVYSGRVAKSSYSITGSLERHLNLPSWGAAIVSGWPLLGPICAGLVVIFALGLRRTAALLSLLLLVVVLLLSTGLLIVGSRAAGPITIATLGPAVTLAGAAVASVGAGRLGFRRAG